MLHEIIKTIYRSGTVLAFNESQIMEKRAFERIDTNIPVKYFCENMLYTGTIKNLSENGMYISTSNFLPCKDKIEMIIPLKATVTTFKSRIRRIEKINDSIFNIGVEILNPPASFIDFVADLKYASKSGSISSANCP